MMATLVTVLVLLGAGLVWIACVGLLRLPDLYTRMHASTKPATLGVSLIVVALAIQSQDVGIGARALLIVLFLYLTTPVAAHLLGRAAYRQGVPLWSGSVRDDLAGHLEAPADSIVTSDD